jgi:hypothetical protein
MRDDEYVSRHARACRGHPRLGSAHQNSKSWMAGTSPATTIYGFNLNRRCYEKYRSHT